MGQTLDPKDKKRPKNPTATSEEPGAKTGVCETIVRVLCTQRHLGVGKPPKPSLQPDPWPHWFSSVLPLSYVRRFATPRTAARQASLSITNSQSLLKLMSIESVMPSNHLILCQSLLLSPSIFPSIRVFFSESILYIRWPKYWSFSFSLSPSK